MRPIKVAWVNDARGSYKCTPEEEVEEGVRELTKDLGYKLDLVAHSRFMENVDRLDIDLLVFDYGGASGAYSDTPWTQLEAACRWAQEHPGRLVLLYSSFTGRMYQNLVKYESAKALESENVMYWLLPGFRHSVDDDREQRDRIRAWFVGGDFEPWVDPNPPHAHMKAPGRR